MEIGRRETLIFHFKNTYGYGYRQKAKFGIKQRDADKTGSSNNEHSDIEWELTYLEPISTLEEIEESN